MPKNSQYIPIICLIALLSGTPAFPHFSGKSSTGSFFGVSKAEAKKKKPKKAKVQKKGNIISVDLSQLPVKIIGDDNCGQKTAQALGLLKEKANASYEVIGKYIGVVECASSGSGMYVSENPPRFQAGMATVNAGAVWYAGAIAHDSCHSKQYRDYLSGNLNSGIVPSNIYSGAASERQCLDYQYDILKKIGADRETLEYLKNIINTEYWNVSYENRWW